MMYYVLSAMWDGGIEVITRINPACPACRQAGILDFRTATIIPES